ncbi:MAG: acyl-CoA dehydrogenase family protein [Ectothiorhodospiraceae bacterium]|nr:acyl-CoA dehydrogenase family protein [Ectothiorhodospiraceae bacterium]
MNDATAPEARDTTGLGHDMLAVARSLGPEIAAAADRTDAECEIPPPLAARLADAGLFRMLVPRRLGGGELDLPTYVRVLEEVARADGSTGWCVNQGAVFATNAAFMDPEAAREIWSDPRAAISNGPSPTARAEVVEGGYRLSGHWAFSSGIRHATWVAGLAFVERAGERVTAPDGGPVLRHFVVPKSEVTIVENWDVRGLRGTGSHHFEVHDLFVPERFGVYTYSDPAREPGPLYKFPMILLFASGFSSVALGIARASLDALAGLAGGRVPRGMQTLRDQPLVQMQMGRAEAGLRAARALLHETVREVWHDVETTGELTVEHRVRLRLATTHAIRSAASTVDTAYDGFGAEGIYASSPIQRRFQDIHVVTQHVQARMAHYESAGRWFLGLEPDMRWL